MVLYGHSSVGRAQVSKTWCREFESLCPCQNIFIFRRFGGFYFVLVFCFILVYIGYVMDIELVVNIFSVFLFSIVYIFAVLLFAFMLGGFLTVILGYFMVKRIENPEILQNKRKSHQRALNIFIGIFLTILAGSFILLKMGANFAMVVLWLGGLIATPFACAISYNLSFIIFAKRKDIRLKLEELEMLKRSNRF